MVKEPRPGRVKTRLGREIGMVRAAQWYRHQVARLLRRLDDPRWRLVLAVAPDSGTAHRGWPADLPRWPQGRGDLGARMRRALARAGGPACLIGSDIPQVQPRHIRQAFAALGTADVVFGPAPDGGYWLIGARDPARLPPGALCGVRWSGPHALGDSQASLAGRRIAQVATLADVDRAADLR